MPYNRLSHLCRYYRHSLNEIPPLPHCAHSQAASPTPRLFQGRLPHSACHRLSCRTAGSSILPSPCLSRSTGHIPNGLYLKQAEEYPPVPVLQHVPFPSPEAVLQSPLSVPRKSGVSYRGKILTPAFPLCCSIRRYSRKNNRTYQSRSAGIRCRQCFRLLLPLFPGLWQNLFPALLPLHGALRVPPHGLRFLRSALLPCLP